MIVVLLNTFLQWSGFRLELMTSEGYQAWGLLGPVLPLTGWVGPYVGRVEVRQLTAWRMTR